MESQSLLPVVMYVYMFASLQVSFVHVLVFSLLYVLAFSPTEWLHHTVQMGYFAINEEVLIHGNISFIQSDKRLIFSIVTHRERKV